MTNNHEALAAPPRFEEAIRLLGDWISEGRWAPVVHWPAQEDFAVRGPHVILRKPVSPTGIQEHRARYRRGLRSRSRIVLAAIARPFGATFGVVDLREASTGLSDLPTVEFELWDFPLRLMTARHRTGWLRLQDAARHPPMARLLSEYGMLSSE